MEVGTWTLEAAEAELNRFIDRRAEKNGQDRPEEVMYAESVRRYHSRRRDERLWERLRYHERMLKNHAAAFTEILERHKAGVSRCEEMLGIGESRG